MASNQKQTLLELLNDRGYTCISYFDENDDDEKVKAPDSLYLHATKPNSNLVVFWEKENLGVKQEREYWPWCRSHNINRVIIISKKVTSSARKEIEETNLIVHIFSPKELYRNITKHAGFQRMKKLTSDERNILLKRYQFDKLPLLSSSDISCRYYGWVPDDIICINRNWGGKQHSSLYYRRVVPNYQVV